jgi:hypothetical protein
MGASNTRVRSSICAGAVVGSPAAIVSAAISVNPRNRSFGP